MNINKFNHRSIDDTSTKRKYKCPDCPARFNKVGFLYKHIEKEHSGLIPDGVTVKQYTFNRRNKRRHGSCIIDGKKTEWNEDKGRYESFCSDRCKLIARERFQENMKKKYGTDNLAADPEFQKKMMANRKLAGKYKFSDGGEVNFFGSYEEHFLKFLDEDFGYKSTDIIYSPLVFDYKDEDGKDRFYIPDFYVVSLNLVIEIKDGGSNPNKHPKILAVDKVREKLKDKAVIATKSYNYIKIVNKEYDLFIALSKRIQNIDLAEKRVNEIFICIPE